MSELYIHAYPKSPSRVTEGTSRVVRGTSDGALAAAPWLDMLCMEGREFCGSDADQNDALLGQTSFVVTTPTLLLHVPLGTTAIPSFVHLCQAGSVGGGAVDVLIEYDNAARYSSGGTSETVLALRTDNPVTNNCTLYSNPTASSGYGTRVWGATIGQDVSPAEGAVNGVFLSARKGTLPMGYLVGPAALAIYTYATSTGPTWLWSIGWFEVPSSSINA